MCQSFDTIFFKWKSLKHLHLFFWSYCSWKKVHFWSSLWTHFPSLRYLLMWRKEHGDAQRFSNCLRYLWFNVAIEVCQTTSSSFTGNLHLGVLHLLGHLIQFSHLWKWCEIWGSPLNCDLCYWAKQEHKAFSEETSTSKSHSSRKCTKE